MPKMSTMKLKESSEERLEVIGLPEIATLELTQAISNLAEAHNLEILNLEPKVYLELSIGSGFKYWPSYKNLKNRLSDSGVIASTVLIKGKVVAFSIATRVNDSTINIDIIDVDSSYQRSSGCSVDWVYKGKQFSAGIGHYLVLHLINNSIIKLTTNATNSRSRYIFKSLGFNQQSGSTNSCLLER